MGPFATHVLNTHGKAIDLLFIITFGFVVPWGFISISYNQWMMLYSQYDIASVHSFQTLLEMLHYRPLTDIAECAALLFTAIVSYGSYALAAVTMLAWGLTVAIFVSMLTSA